MRSLLTLLLTYSLAALTAQSFCVSVEAVSNSDNEVTVDVILYSTSDFRLGTSNIQFSFDPNVLSSPTLVQDGLPGIPTYRPTNVTEVTTGEASVNIELAFAGLIPGSIVTGDGLTVATISFTKNVNRFDQGFSVSYNGGTTETVVFLDDDVTQIFADAEDDICLRGVLADFLPITYRDFEATPQDKNVVLDWVTSAETNNRGFHVLHGTDGDTFEAIGFVDGENVASTYSFVHHFPATGNNYYCLSQEDYDGTQGLSQIRIVVFKSNVPQSLVFPNPTTDYINLGGFDPEDFISVKLMDITGRILLESKKPQLLDVSNFPEGAYCVEIRYSAQVDYHKIVIKN